MKSTITKCLAVASVLCAVSLTGCLQKPMWDAPLTESMSAPDDSCVGPGCYTKVTLEVKNYDYKLSSAKKMREVISASALKAYWYVAMQSPTDLTLTYWGHDGKTLVYAVSLSEEGYTLTYEDSGSMKYNEETGDIHPLYDLWFWGGERYGLYGLVPTLRNGVYNAYLDERMEKRHKQAFDSGSKTKPTHGGGGGGGGSGPGGGGSGGN